MGSFSLDSCRIQTVCLIYRQRLDCLHSSSPLRASCGEPSIMRYSILVLRFQSSSSSLVFLVSRSSFSVHRSIRCLPVSRSSFSVRYHVVIVAVDLYVLLAF